ncbi:MAG: hypothetical protein COT74_14180 [Bdellovibrionales bacterium CG10_big_fil_rev_8_21_14_0_10_45_34]|nr:MAG: hypothetical protein COT74_14180 [Bdellovibrionales bacterium CG10_big_fil_rev_8_21_14_0_10_45_34]
MTSPVNLFISAVYSLEESAVDWTVFLHDWLRGRQLFPSEEQPTRHILLKYEDDGIEKGELQNPLVDDLIYIPLDQQLFLQKVYICLNLPKKTSAQFLYDNATKLKIEMSKKTSIDRLSEFGLAIFNPVPITKRVVGHFFLKLPHMNEPISLFGKATFCDDHPEQKGYLVFFNFFGLSRNLQHEIRTYLHSFPDYHPLKSEDPSSFSPPTDITRKQLERVVVVLTRDPEKARRMSDILQSSLSHFQVIEAPSLGFFLKRYLEKKSFTYKWVLAAADEDNTLNIHLTLKDGSITAVEIKKSQPESEKFIDWPHEELVADKDAFKKMISNKDAVELFEETFLNVKMGSTSRICIPIASKSGEQTLVKVEVRLSRSHYTVTFSPPDEEQVKILDRKLDRLDAIIMDDELLLGVDLSSWIVGVRELCRKNKIIGPKSWIPLFLYTSQSDHPETKKYINEAVTNIFYDPIDIRFFIYALSVNLESPYTIYNHQNIVWKSTNLPVYVAKETQCEFISEFGATIRHPRPLKPGSYLYLHREIYDRAPNKNLMCRIYFVEEDQSTKEWLCSMSYFGVTESFLKEARRWIREVYADKKSKEDT